MPGLVTFDVSEVIAAFQLGAPAGDGPQHISRNTYRLTTEQGTFAVRDHGQALPGGGIRGPHWSLDDIEMAVRWEVECQKLGARIAAPVLATGGHPTAAVAAAPDRSDDLDGPRVISVHQWIEGHHPRAGTVSQARRFGAEVGEAVALFHAVGLNRAGSASVDINVPTLHWAELREQAEIIGSDIGRRLERLKPALDRMETALAGDEVQSIATFVHGDLGTDNVVIATSTTKAHVIDFDLIWGKYGSALGEVAALGRHFVNRDVPALASVARQFTASVNTAYLATMGDHINDHDDFAAGLMYADVNELVESLALGARSPELEFSLSQCEGAAQVLTRQKGLDASL